MSKLKMLQPRLKELDLVAASGIKMLKTTRTLKDKQADNGRTLALNGAAWRKLRAYVLSGEPLCRHCTTMGRTVIATDVDHYDNDARNNALENMQPLCHMHHSLKTARSLGHNVTERLGCDSSGKPLDPNHPWNNATKAVLSRPDGTAEKIAGTATDANRLSPSR